ncbi:MAG: hypothetical protein Q9205_005761 [Flavoplaca limonia]
MVVPAVPEIIEEEIESAVDSRNESLPSLRELGPPDLVHLVKQSIKSGNKQVRSIVAMLDGLGPNFKSRVESITTLRA